MSSTQGQRAALQPIRLDGLFVNASLASVGGRSAGVALLVLAAMRVSSSVHRSPVKGSWLLACHPLF